ncbi:MAG: hypothetical protein GYB65_06720, partial [Chloroflexi bacterium]|nr:hypothetical protein [Chloroflexota bacterium]
MSRRTIGYFVLGSTLLVALMLLSAATIARSGPLLQGEATAQQMTVESAINQRLTQTADAVLMTQAPTLTAAIEATIETGMQQTQTAEAAYPLTVTAEYLAFEATVSAGVIQTQEAIIAATAAYESAPPIPQPVEPMTGSNRYAVERLATLTGHTGEVRQLYFNADGTRLASYGRDETVRVWEFAKGTNTLTLPVNDYVYRLAFNTDSTLLAAATRGDAVYVWDANTGVILHLLAHADADFVTFQDDGTLVSTSWDLRITWDVRTGEALAVQELEEGDAAAEEEPECAYTRSPWDSDLRAYSDYEEAAEGEEYQPCTSLLLRDYGSDNGARNIGSHRDSVYALRFSPDGRWLASGDDSGVIMLWG